MLLTLCACSNGSEKQASSEPTDISAAEETAVPTDTEPSEEPNTVTVEPFVFDPETDFDNRTVNGISSFIDLDEAYIYQYGALLSPVFYWDKTTEESGVLCSKPECVHNDGDCGGWLGNLAKLGYYKGRLYWITFPYNAGGQSVYTLNSMNVDSTDRREEHRFTIETAGDYAQRMFIHRGFAFLLYNKKVVENTEPMVGERIDLFDLSSGDIKTIFETRTRYGANILLQFGGDNIYILSSRAEDENSLSVSLDSYNIITGGVGHSEYRIERPEMWINDFRLTPDGKILLALDTDYEDYPGGVYKIEDGVISEAFRFDDGEHVFAPLFADGAVCAITLVEREPKKYMFWITDYEGNTIYKGEVPMEYRNSIAEQHVTMGRNILVGIGSSLYTTWEENVGNDERDEFFLVRYDITPDGFTETVLGSYAE